MAVQMNSSVYATTTATSPPPVAQGKKDEGREALAVVKIEVEEQDDAAAGVDYADRAQWLRAAVLGVNDGLVSVASLMIGVGAVNQSARAMLVSGLAGLVAGACSMAIGEFVSVHAQYDIEVAARRLRRKRGLEEEPGKLPIPAKAAAASALAFAAGAALPLLAGGLVRPWAVRVAAVCAVTTAGLAGFGAVGGALGGTSPARSGVRVLLGGWAAMAVCYSVLWLSRLAMGVQVSGATC
ncbi:vacuolar iron transporter homolog 3-like [Lolium perenne]|uniref:vacuolar iron transporter homolog 3-like n=1 Tax=Lolium perenne TaxID=4522 RepID=UPI0021EA3A02|nr:vacuolar iron transporter homolog 3-like [Lolium perenne]